MQLPRPRIMESAGRQSAEQVNDHHPAAVVRNEEEENENHVIEDEVQEIASLPLDPADLSSHQTEILLQFQVSDLRTNKVI